MKNCFVFLDVDGTIYTPRHGVPDSTKEALEKLKKNGHYPVICTGRTRSMIFPELLSLDLPGLIGGVGMYGEWQGEVLFDETIEPEEVEKLYEGFLHFGFVPVPEGTHHLYYEPGFTEEPLKALKRIFSLSSTSMLEPFAPGASDICKVSALFGEGCDVAGMKELIHGRYHAINHHDILLETFSVDTSKGIGMQKLLKGLKREDATTFAYGDSFNDLEMLEQADYGVCMGNGDPKLLSRIPRHAKPLAEDGLYFSLKEFGLI